MEMPKYIFVPFAMFTWAVMNWLNKVFSMGDIEHSHMDLPITDI